MYYFVNQDYDMMELFIFNIIKIMLKNDQKIKKIFLMIKKSSNKKDIKN